MKKMAIVLGALIVASVFQFVAPATSGPNSNIARRVTALESKVKSLQRSVASAKADAGAAKADAGAAKADAGAAKAKLACLTAAGLSRLGDPASQKGYLWAEGGALYVTTGLDLTPSGQTPSLNVASIDTSCVTSSSFSTKAAPGRTMALRK
jgi:hypothetical protein